MASTEYSLDAGATWTTGTEIPLTVVGTYTLSFRSTDVAGNVEEIRSAEVTVTARGGTEPGTAPAESTPGATPGGSGAGAGTTPGGTVTGGLALTGTEAPIAVTVLAPSLLR